MSRLFAGNSRSVITYGCSTTQPGSGRSSNPKFLVSPSGEVVARFHRKTEPEADEVVAAVEAALPA